MADLSAEYQAVEREIFRLEDRAGELGRELAKAQIAQVSYRINDLEEKIRLTGRNPILFRQIVQGRIPTLFERDRATLNRVLQNEPELAPEAQSVLDRLVILTMYVSDQPKPCPIKKMPPRLPQNPSEPCITTSE